MIILGIETSCDDTSVAVYDAAHNKVLSCVTSSHPELTSQGIILETIARAHSDHILPIFQLALKEADITASALQLIAYTQGPGMISSLIVGSCFAKGLGYSLGIPCIGVNHLLGHILSCFLERPMILSPYIAAVISGGHSNLYYVCDNSFKLIGQTMDDSAGEVLDKCAALMGYTYPGGPKIEKLALHSKHHGHNKYTLPVPMLKHASLDLSFSGLKSAFARAWHSSPQAMVDRYHLAASLQNSVIISLLAKIKKSLGIFKTQHLCFVGGVSANLFFRSEIDSLAQKQGFTTLLAPLSYCQDNAAMIALAGYHQMQLRGADKNLSIQVYTRREIE